MKYVYQFLIILAVSFVGELLNYLIDLPIPGSIYGLLIMIILLCSGLIKLSWVKDAAGFMISIMPVVYICSSVGLMSSFSQFASILIPIIVISVVSTIVVMVTTGRVSQAVIRHSKVKNKIPDTYISGEADK